LRKLRLLAVRQIVMAQHHQRVVESDVTRDRLQQLFGHPFSLGEGGPQRAHRRARR
jgi:hypothetical protein